MSINNITEGYGKNIAMIMQEEHKKHPERYDLSKILESRANNTASSDTVHISEEANKRYENSVISVEHNFPEGLELKTLSGVCTMGVYNDFNRAMSALSSKTTDPDTIGAGYYSEGKVSELCKHFQREDGEKTDTFTQYANKMAAVYQMMSDAIDEKYADPNRKQDVYYMADDGTTQILTKEKEHEMLDRVYKDQSEFMATSTEIWNTMAASNYYTIYEKSPNNSNTETDNTHKQAIVDCPKGEIKNAALQVFMSVIGIDNTTKLYGTGGSWNHMKLNYGISEAQVNNLNQIWNFYANKKQA